MLEKIKEHIIFTINSELKINKLDDYKKKGGVWCLIGADGFKYKVLQVASTNNIFKEIDIDSFFLADPIIKEKKDYINQFAEFIFDYEFISEKSILYNEIYKKHKELIFVNVYTCDEKELRDSVESYFAWRTSAKYWRNGGSYKKSNIKNKNKNIDHIKKEKINILNGDLELIKDIDKMWEDFYV